MELDEENYLKHINIGDKKAIADWCEKLNCRENDFIDAVMKVGSLVSPGLLSTEKRSKILRIFVFGFKKLFSLNS